MKYYLVSICIGPTKYEPIEPHFINRINERCPNAIIKTIKEIPDNIKDDFIYNIFNENIDSYGWWDVVRLKKIIELLETDKIPVVHCDMDIIIEKDIQKLIDIPYDIIFSREFGENHAFPESCSKIIGFGLCTGFSIIKPTENAIKYLKKLYDNMINKFYNTYSDQINLMNMISKTKYSISNKFFIENNTIFTNNIISLNDENIDICVLDYDLIIRDPEYTKNQFANHLNLDNVGGTSNLINYYYNKLEDLPLTCRCGKFENTNICIHRKKL